MGAGAVDVEFFVREVFCELIDGGLFLGERLVDDLGESGFLWEGG